jgi:hypothetical protein
MCIALQHLLPTCILISTRHIRQCRSEVCGLASRLLLFLNLVSPPVLIRTLKPLAAAQRPSQLPTRLLTCYAGRIIHHPPPPERPSRHMQAGIYKDSSVLIPGGRRHPGGAGPLPPAVPVSCQPKSTRQRDTAAVSTTTEEEETVGAGTSGSIPEQKQEDEKS